MVIIKKIIIFSLAFWCLLFSPIISSADKISTPEEVEIVASDIRNSLEELSQSFTKKNLQNLKENLVKYKAMIAYAGQAVERAEGGAVTRNSSASVRTLTHFGVDIANALFTFRTEYGEELARSGLEQQFEDLMVNELEFPMLQMAFSVLRHKVDERSGVDGKVTFFDVLRRTFLEVGRDFFSLISGGRNRTTGEFFYTPVESARREALARDMIAKYRSYSTSHIPEFNKLFDGNLEYNRENHEERLGGLLLWLTDRAVNIRVERDSAQWYARMFYLVTGAVLAQPIFNFVESSYSAHFESSVMTMSAFATLYLLKGATSSTRSTREWLAFNQQVRLEMASGLIQSTEIYLSKQFPADYRPAVVPTWIQREASLRKALAEVTAVASQPIVQSWKTIKRSCSAVLGRKKE